MPAYNDWGAQARRQAGAVAPTRSSGGRTSRGGARKRPSTNQTSGGQRPVPQYKERERRNVADDAVRREVLAYLAKSVGQQGPGGGGPPGGTTAPANMPQVPIEPVVGNPYKGVEGAIGRFAQASERRSAGDVKAAKAALKGRADPGRDITGSFDTQAAGMAAERAASATALRNQARAGFAEEELRFRSESYTNRFKARQEQIKNDADLMGGGQMSLSMVQQLEAEGIDSSQYLNNPMLGMIALGRARFARRGEAGLPPTAWAQAAQYGLRPPNTYDDPQDFYWNLGQAKSGMYGGGDVTSVLQGLISSGLLKPEDLGG